MAAATGKTVGTSGDEGHTEKGEETRKGNEKPVPPAKKPEFKYFFHFQSPLDSLNIGETPTGFRIDLKYRRHLGTLGTSAKDYATDWITAPVKEDVGAGNLDTYDKVRKARSAPEMYDILRRLRRERTLEWFGIEGRSLNGGDWALVRSDAVAVFDGRVTLETFEHGQGKENPDGKEDGFIFDMIVRGHVDLRGSKPLDEAAVLFQQLRNGQTIDSLPIRLAVNFEGAQNEASWTSKEIRRRASHHWKYARLMRGQFIGVGMATFGEQLASPLTAIEFDVFEVSQS